MPLHKELYIHLHALSFMTRCADYSNTLLYTNMGKPYESSLQTISITSSHIHGMHINGMYIIALTATKLIIPASQ